MQFLPIPVLAEVSIYAESPLYREGANLPESILRSDRYEVVVAQQGRDYTPFVHLSKARTEGPGTQFIQGRTVSWTDFSLSGTAWIRIRFHGDEFKPGDEVTVYPLRHGIQPRVEEGTVSFPIPGPGQYLVEDFRFTMAGDWILTFQVTLPDGRSTIHREVTDVVSAPPGMSPGEAPAPADTSGHAGHAMADTSGGTR